MIGHTTQAWCYVDFPWFSCESPLCVVINWIADSRCSHWCFSVCCQSDWMFQAVWLGGRTWTHPLQHYKASDWKSAIPALWQRNSSTNKFLWGHLSLPLQYATDTRWGLWNCLHPSPVRQKQQYKMFLMLNIGFQETVCCLGVHKEHMKWLDPTEALRYPTSKELSIGSFKIKVFDLVKDQITHPRLGLLRQGCCFLLLVSYYLGHCTVKVRIACAQSVCLQLVNVTWLIFKKTCHWKCHSCGASENVDCNLLFWNSSEH